MEAEVPSPEEWGELEAAKAPPWAPEDRERIAGILGLTLKPLPGSASDAA